MAGGCAAPAFVGTLSAGASAPAATDGSLVDSGLAPTLQNAVAGTTFDYRPVQGGEELLVLGPLYQSARGVPCRLGRLSPADFGSVSLNSYPFCRFGNDWYAMRPVVVSGY
jgi:hypothetical protein